MMSVFKCHRCLKTHETVQYEFDTYEDLRQHRRIAHSEDFADGRPWFMCEIVVMEKDYYWIARQTRDTRWLKARGC